jgi:hypothetical protein
MVVASPFFNIFPEDEYRVPICRDIDFLSLASVHHLLFCLRIKEDLLL